MSTLQQVLPASPLENVSDVALMDPILFSQTLPRVLPILRSNLPDDGIRQLVVIDRFAHRLASPLFHIRAILPRRAFNNVPWVETGRSVAGMAGMRRRPVTMRQEEGQPMRQHGLAVILALSVTSLTVDRKRPNKAIVRSMGCDSTLEPHEMLFGLYGCSAFFSSFLEQVEMSLGADIMGHLRSFIAMVLGWVRFRERPGSLIIKIFR